MIIQALSLLWSTDLRLGLRTVAYSIPFFLVAAGAYSLSKKNPRTAFIALSATMVILAFQALMVITFRIYPELEITYLRSSIAGIFSGPNVINSLLDGSERNNVLDPQKAGGVYVNANIAAAYLGMSSFIAFLLFKIRRSFLLFITALLLWTSTLFTGSKAGIILAISLPLVAFYFQVYRSNKKNSRPLMLLSTIAATPILVGLAAFSLDNLAEKSSFAAASIDTASIRLMIWSYAAQAFTESPIFGQGFGGWQRGYETYALATGIPPEFPPHNTLIYLWSQSGIIAAMLGLLFMFHVMRLAYQLTASQQRNTRLLGLTLGMAAGWLFIQGLGENSGHLGDPRQQPILAALVGIAYANVKSRTAATTLRQPIQTSQNIKDNGLGQRPHIPPPAI